MAEQRLTPKVTVIPATKQQEQSHHGGRNLRVAAYCRVSSKKDEQEHSFEVQKAYYTEKITKNPEWKMAGIYADEGITGTSMKKRDDFKRMLRACREGRIDLILVKSVARFGRNTVDVMKTVRSLQERGIGVIFEKEGLDTRNMNSELMLAFHSAFSQSESESIRENVSWGYRKSFEMGKVSVHKNTFGFTKLENKDIAINEEQGAAMQLMFDLCLDGVSFYGIKLELEKRGIKNPTGGSIWSVSTIKSILQNEKCKGDALLQKTYRPTLFSKRVANDGVLPKYYVSNCLPQIIKPEIFDRVQAEIGRRQSKRPASDNAKNPYQGKHSGKYALSSLMFCANCGAPYRRVTWTIHGKKKIVWRCVSRLDHGKAICKDSPSLEETALHKAIMDAILENFIDPDTAFETIQQSLTSVFNAYINDDADIYARLRELKELKKTLIQKCLDEGDDGRYDLQFTNIINETEALNQQLAGIREAAQSKKLSNSRLEEIKELLVRFRASDMEFDNALVYRIVREIRVHTDGQLEIAFQNGVSVRTHI